MNHLRCLIIIIKQFIITKVMFPMMVFVIIQFTKLVPKLHPAYWWCSGTLFLALFPKSRCFLTLNHFQSYFTIQSFLGNVHKIHILAYNLHLWLRGVNSYEQQNDQNKVFYQKTILFQTTLVILKSNIECLQLNMQRFQAKTLIFL